MTVIPFSPARFTPADLSEFFRISQPRLARGLWSRTVRNTCSDGDQILIYFRHMDLPAFRFERDCSGTYTLYFRSASSADWGLICTGTSAADCLSIWATSRRASA